MPSLQIPHKLEPLLSKHKRYKIIIGGRGSAKSTSVADIMSMKMETEAADVLCLREIQDSIDDSVHKLIQERLVSSASIDRFIVADKKIQSKATGAVTKYKGTYRNPSAIKSAQGFKYSWYEEAQNISEATLLDLLPTIREDGAELWFTANPKSSGDPFSKRFIVPYLKELLSNGYYEDDMHIIIVMNWRDNPWFPEGLNQERLWDYNNKTRAEYDHIWEGMFNDSVEYAIISPEWFDACIDAHIKLGIKPLGIEVIAHDPSDTGPDSKGLAYRHGIVIKQLWEKKDGTINDGGDWASDIAISIKPDYFTWDCDGMGVGLNRQFTDSLTHKKISLQMYKGSESPRNPKSAYETINGKIKTNEEAFFNKRAQAYWLLRERMRKTFLAVIKGEYQNPDDIISISSEIELIQMLRSELCRIPTIPNGSGKIQLMSKENMKKIGISSPNLADSVVMAMFLEPSIKNIPTVNVIPTYSPFAKR